MHLPLAVAAWETYERLGSPEGELALAQLVVHLATAPKSNAAYKAYNAARRAAQGHGQPDPARAYPERAHAADAGYWLRQGV
jgi:putative ATPase